MIIWNMMQWKIKYFLCWSRTLISRDSGNECKDKKLKQMNDVQPSHNNLSRAIGKALMGTMKDCGLDPATDSNH